MQGSHRSGKLGKVREFGFSFSRPWKVRENGKFLKSQGKVREFIEPVTVYCRVNGKKF